MDQRFILVRCHRGKEAIELHREYKKHRDRFDFHASLLDRDGWTHLTRKNTSTHYRFKHGRKPYALELREVTRLFWPPGAKVDPRTSAERRRERQFPRHAHTNVILREWAQRKKKAAAAKCKTPKRKPSARRIPGLNAPPIPKRKSR